MPLHKHLYSYRYHKYESALCKLESTALFDKTEENKTLSSNTKLNPSISAFIKNRIDIISSNQDYEELIDHIKLQKIATEGFKVEYLVLHDDDTPYKERLQKLRDVGFSINAYPDYYNPLITYALCLYKETWCFGVLNKNNFEWESHNQKPRSYSHSIPINTAKALVNIASRGRKEHKLLDACCGVGTIMLEACFALYSIEGCDINWKLCGHARENLSHFSYTALIHCCDIKDIGIDYDTAIVDLPYNLYSNVTDDDVLHIIKSSSSIANQLVIVSTADISNTLSEANLHIVEYCDVPKIGKTKFARKIWVCEKST